MKIKIKRKFSWELIHETKQIDATFRADVPGGWLFLHQSFDQERTVNESMVFVPKPQPQNFGGK